MIDRMTDEGIELLKVHHLNCDHDDPPTAQMVCHVLLVETDNGLVLVDTGFGSPDCADPARRRHARLVGGHRDETAVRQVSGLVSPKRCSPHRGNAFRRRGPYLEAHDFPKPGSRSCDEALAAMEPQ